MGQHYSDPKRAKEANALPDVETFEAKAGEWYVDEDGERVDASEVEPWEHPEQGTWGYQVKDTRMACEPCKAGWYWWFCLPGCLPDSEPYGPFKTEEAAIRAMRKECRD
jgi:hypothetical protein